MTDEGKEDLKDYGPILRRGLIEHLPKLQGAPLSVFIYLMLMADRRDFRTQASVEDIAEKTGYSTRTVKHAIRFLAECKEAYIIIEEPNNPWIPRTYYIPKLRLSGAKSTPRRREGSYKHSGAKSTPLDDLNSGEENTPRGGQKVPHCSGEPSGELSGEPSGEPRGAKSTPPIIDSECPNDRMTERAKERALQFFQLLESITAVWPVKHDMSGDSGKYTHTINRVCLVMDNLSQAEIERICRQDFERHSSHWTVLQFLQPLEDEMERRETEVEKREQKEMEDKRTRARAYEPEDNGGGDPELAKASIGDILGGLRPPAEELMF